MDNSQLLEDPSLALAKPSRVPPPRETTVLLLLLGLLLLLLLLLPRGVLLLPRRTPTRVLESEQHALVLAILLLLSLLLPPATSLRLVPASSKPSRCAAIVESRMPALDDRIGGGVPRPSVAGITVDGLPLVVLAADSSHNGSSGFVAPLLHGLVVPTDSLSSFAASPVGIVGEDLANSESARPSVGFDDVSCDDGS
jgi:hypothetical protein